MSAPVMVTSLCLVSLSTPASPVLPDHCSQFCWVSNLHLQFILLLLCLILVYYCYIKYIMFVRVCVDSVYGHLTFVLLNRLLDGEKSHIYFEMILTSITKVVHFWELIGPQLFFLLWFGLIN